MVAMVTAAAVTAVAVARDREGVARVREVAEQAREAAATVATEEPPAEP